MKRYKNKEKSVNGLSKDSKEMKNLFGPEYAPLDDDAFTPKY